MAYDTDHKTRGRLGAALAATVVVAVAVASLLQRVARRARSGSEEPVLAPMPVTPAERESVPSEVESHEDPAAWSPTPLAAPVVRIGASAPPVWEPTHGTTAGRTSRFGEWDVDDVDADAAPDPGSGLAGAHGSDPARAASLPRFASWSAAVALLGLAILGGVAVNGATADDVVDPLAAAAPEGTAATPPPVEEPAASAVPPATPAEPEATQAPPAAPVNEEPAAEDPAPVATPVVAPDPDVPPADEDEVCDEPVVDEDDANEPESCTPADDATGVDPAPGVGDEAPAAAGQAATDEVASSDAAVAVATESVPAAVPGEPAVEEVDQPLRGAVGQLPIYDLEVAVGAEGATGAAHRSQKPGKSAGGTGAPKVNAPGLDGTRTESGAPIEAPPAAQILSSPLMPTPEQIRLYVRAAKTEPLPRLKTVDHKLAGRFATAGRRYQVGWTLLAALAREESNYGMKKGHGLVGTRLSDADYTRYARHAGRTGPITRADPGDALAAVSAYLKVHGASREAMAPGKSTPALTAYLGSRDAADRVTAHAAFLGALGTYGLQHGLAASSKRLRLRVAKDTRIELYDGGRRDVKQGRVDTRVLLVAEYLANSFGHVRLSSLVTGHRLFSSSGNVSAHVYGRAVDVAEVGHTSIYGHQDPGSVTERAVKLLLMLPGKVQPRQVISLLDLDGPSGNRGSFSLADHDDHIHVGY